jgi:hypothetical protein
VEGRDGEDLSHKRDKAGVDAAVSGSVESPHDKAHNFASQVNLEDITTQIEAIA